MTMLDTGGGFPSVTSGGVFLLRPNGKPIRVRDVSNKGCIDAMGPEGPVRVCVDIANFNEKLFAAVLRGPGGAGNYFALNNIPLYLTPSQGRRMTVGEKYKGFRMNKGDREDVVLTVDVIRFLGRPDYEHVLTANGPIYIGAGKNPVFLPFFVRRT